MTTQELVYWYALNNITKVNTKRKNSIYIAAYKREPRLNIIELFENEDLWPELALTEAERKAFVTAKKSLSNYSFEVEKLLNEGIELIPFHDPDDRYPQILKINLGRLTPTLLFTKGEASLLKQHMIAIVGSRDANNIALQFTQNVAARAVAEDKVVVSGFAKGIDRCALDAALYHKGRSVIVLPQGIATVSSSLRAYYQQILEGKLLILSTYNPNDRWAVGRAMGRNKFVYGLANQIYVAQTQNSGGTWEGATEGLKAKRPIYVRLPEPQEAVANGELMKLGTRAVDLNGNEVPVPPEFQPVAQAEEAPQMKQGSLL